MNTQLRCSVTLIMFYNLIRTKTQRSLHTKTVKEHTARIVFACAWADMAVNIVAGWRPPASQLHARGRRTSEPNAYRNADRTGTTKWYVYGEHDVVMLSHSRSFHVERADGWFSVAPLSGILSNEILAARKRNRHTTYKMHTNTSSGVTDFATSTAWLA